MTALLATRMAKADAAAAADAARVLAAGGLVAFPTETVYGLGADATSGPAVARLYEAKGRPAFNPLIAHVADIVEAKCLARFDADAARLAKDFWPGPLTLVLPKAAGCPVADLATAGLDTIAVRVPAHKVARDILAAFGKPVVAPSANRSGHVSPTRAEHVEADLGGRIDLIIDGGATPVGVEFDDRRLPRRAGPAAARAACRGRRSSASLGVCSPMPHGRRQRATRSHPACSLPTMRRAHGRGSMPAASRPGKPCLPSGPAGRRRRAREVRAQPLGTRRSRRGGGEFVLASAGARCGGHRDDRRHADPRRGPR